MNLIVIIYFIVLVFIVVLAVRNNTVLKYRLMLIDKIHKQYDRYDEHKEKMKIFDKVSYDHMVLQFWKPLKAFFPPNFPD